MKCKIPEISWHNRDPVLSVDIQSKYITKDGTTMCRLASGGTDAHVLIWHVSRAEDDHDIKLELAADLSRHQRAVNTVRWSPNGELLASGDDESVIFIWKQKGENEIMNIVDTTNEYDKEVWITLKILRGHTEDVYDLSWSPNSQFLVTGSVDNTAMMWDVHKGKSLVIFDDHKGYVQGVTWDPKNQYIATMSTDRHMRIFDIHTRKVLYRISKSALPVPKGHELHTKSVRLYHDGTLQTFFRRLCFTPDGNLLLTPSGVTDCDGLSKPLYTTYAFSRYDMRQPVFVLPCQDQYTVAVRCSPILYELRAYDPQNNPPVIDLPYRMIFAVATKSSVYFYDTQQKQPFAIISNIHYTRLTDLSWSSDGCIVIVSSTDGFCSLISFNANELGKVYADSDAVLGAAVESNDMAKHYKKSKKQKLARETSEEIDMRRPQHNQQNGLKDDCQSNRLSTSLKPSTVPESVIATEANHPVQKSIVKTMSAEEEKPENRANNTFQSYKKTLIGVKKKPKAVKKSVDEICINKNQRIGEFGKVAKPVALRQNVDQVLNKILATPANSEKKMTILSDIVIDKEILSSAEKFESPEKKNRPPTPIMVRRHPRTPNGATRTFSSATSIAVRPVRGALVVSPLNPPTVAEEAMDAWPSVTQADPPLVPHQTPAQNHETLAEVLLERSLCSEATSDHTEDIKLVYEDTVDELSGTGTSADVAKVLNSTEQIHKTPRRITFNTISIPKSKISKMSI